MSFQDGVNPQRIAELEAENAELREELEDERTEHEWLTEFHTRIGFKIGQSSAHNLVDYVNGLEAENAELRELLARACTCLDELYKEPNELYARTVIAEARALGVEVGE